MIRATLRARAASGLACAALVGCRAPSGPIRGAAPAVSHPPSGQPEARQLISAWIAAQSPGAEHRRLDPLVGQWDLAGWWKPAAPADAPRTELSGRVDASWILDRRFLEARFEGDTVGIPYGGLQLLGYDRLTGRYQLIALESTTTAVNHFEGQLDQTTGTIVFTGTIADPAVSGSYRGVLELHAGRHTFRGFLLKPDGSQVQVSEYIYTPRSVQPRSR